MTFELQRSYNQPIPINQVGPLNDRFVSIGKIRLSDAVGLGDDVHYPCPVSDIGPTPPFLISGPAAGSPLMLSCPHAGRHYPAALGTLSRLPVEALRQLEDPHVDALLDPAVACGFPLIAATYARAWVDLNRHPDEIDPSLLEPAPPPSPHHASARAAGGLGVVPSRLGNGQPIYAGRLVLDGVKARLALVHRPFHDRLVMMLNRIRASHGTALLIDCHSMPSLPRDRAGRPGADIVLGDRHGTSASPLMVATLETALNSQGFNVVRNRPYAGGYVTERHGAPSFGIHAIQMEIDRRLYFDPARHLLRPEAGALARRLADALVMVRDAMMPEGSALAAE